jgi:hypothetical protein
MQGQLVYQGKAVGTETLITLYSRGVYVVVTDRQVVKAVY